MIDAEKRTYEHILFEADGPIARVTMNRPDKRNALSLHMQELTDCLKAIGEAREARRHPRRERTCLQRGARLSEMMGATGDAGTSSTSAAS